MTAPWKANMRIVRRTVRVWALRWQWWKLRSWLKQSASDGKEFLMVGLQVQKNANSIAVAAMALLCISVAMMYPRPPDVSGAALTDSRSRKSEAVRDLELYHAMDRSAKTEDRTSRLESSMANMQLAQATMGQDVKYIVEALKSIFAALGALAVLIIGYLLTRLPQIIGQSQKPD